MLAPSVLDAVWTLSWRAGYSHCAWAAWVNPNRFINEIFSVTTYDMARAAWKLQACRYHPDHGGDPETAAKFNGLWERVKKLYGK
jgi:hypothetical protein